MYSSNTVCTQSQSIGQRELGNDLVPHLPGDHPGPSEQNGSCPTRDT